MIRSGATTAGAALLAETHGAHGEREDREQRHRLDELSGGDHAVRHSPGAARAGRSSRLGEARRGRARTSPGAVPRPAGRCAARATTDRRSTSRASRPSVFTRSAPSNDSWATLDTSPRRAWVRLAGASTAAVEVVEDRQRREQRQPHQHQRRVDQGQAHDRQPDQHHDAQRQREGMITVIARSTSASAWRGAVPWEQAEVLEGRAGTCR